MDAVTPAPGSWKPAIGTSDGARLMMPIFVHMFDDQGNSLFGLTQEEIDEALDVAADAIPQVVLANYAMLSK